MSQIEHPVTKLLEAWRAGDRQAGEELVASVYQELRRLASSYLRGERPGHISERPGAGVSGRA
jgi:hypothetical protein